MHSIEESADLNSPDLEQAIEDLVLADAAIPWAQLREIRVRLYARLAITVLLTLVLGGMLFRFRMLPFDFPLSGNLVRLILSISMVVALLFAVRDYIRITFGLSRLWSQALHLTEENKNIIDDILGGQHGRRNS